MRRKEREVTDIDEIKAVIDSCFALHLGINDNGHIYIVPVNFGYEEENGNFTFYFHGAKDGRKYSLIKDGAEVGFECDCDHGIKAGDIACSYSAYYSSVIGEGHVSEIKSNEHKKDALNSIMKKATGRDDWNFPAVMLSRVAVFKIESTMLTCKMHKR